MDVANGSRAHRSVAGGPSPEGTASGLHPDIGMSSAHGHKRRARPEVLSHRWGSAPSSAAVRYAGRRPRAAVLSAASARAHIIRPNDPRVGDRRSVLPLRRTPIGEAEFSSRVVRRVEGRGLCVDQGVEVVDTLDVLDGLEGRRGLGVDLTVDDQVSQALQV
jgi:hypothetical protein